MEVIEQMLKETGLSHVNFDADLRKKKYFETMKEVVESVVANDTLSLEDKIMVSLYLRLVTERHLKALGYRGPLREKIKSAESDAVNGIEHLKRVNLITPEHIHINSFMYEPLIDMDKNQITDLYNKVETVTKSN